MSGAPSPVQAAAPVAQSINSVVVSSLNEITPVMTRAGSRFTAGVEVVTPLLMNFLRKSAGLTSLTSELVEKVDALISADHSHFKFMAWAVAGAAIIFGTRQFIGIFIDIGLPSRFKSTSKDEEVVETKQ